MSEYCKDCFIKTFRPTKGEIRRLVLSAPEDLELCEGCGQTKRIVVRIKPTLKERIGNAVRTPPGSATRK